MKLKNYLLRTLLFCVTVLTGSGKLWADETIFSAVAKTAWSVPASTSAAEITSTYATISGGNMYVTNEQTSAKDLIKEQGKKAFQMTNNNTYFKVVLNNALQVGDVVSVSLRTGKTSDSADKQNIGLFLTKASSRPNSATASISVAPQSNNTWVDNLTYTVATNDEICGETTFYIYRAVGASTYFTNFTIVRTVADNRQESSVSFGETKSATVDKAEQTTFQLPTPTTTPSGVSLSYESSNTAVATVNNAGLVTLVAMGTAEITAKFAGNNDYKPSSDKFTLTVEDSNFKIFENAGGEGNITNSGIVTVTHKVWDFTNWSEATINNLKADAATSASKGWSDIEKAANVNDPTKAVEGYFWSVANATVGGELTANGTVIEELKGLAFHNAYSTARSLSIINLSNMKCLWLGGSKKSCFTIKNVKVGSQLTMEVESHKTSEARGVQLYYNSVADGNKIGAAFTPTTKASNTWTVTGPSGAETVDVIVQNTNGCHIYTIEADIAEAKTTKVQMKTGIVVAAGYKTTFGNGAIGLTFGKEGDNDFAAATANTNVSGYVASTGGNGGYSNGSGTSYTFEPEYPGTLEVGVVLNANKAFYIEEDGTPLADYNGITVDAKYYGTYTINVMGGKTYKFYAAGSGLGFYGFEYKANVAANIAEFKALADGTTAVLTLTDAKITALASAGKVIIEDASGAMMLDCTGSTLSNLTVGQTCNGRLTVKRTADGGEVVSVMNNNFATAAGTATPTNMDNAVATLGSNANLMRYVTLTNLTISRKYNGETFTSVGGFDCIIVNKSGQRFQASGIGADFKGWLDTQSDPITGFDPAVDANDYVKIASLSGILINGDKEGLYLIVPTKESDVVWGADQSLNEVTIGGFKQLAQEEKARIQEANAWITFVDGQNYYLQNNNKQAIIVNYGDYSHAWIKAGHYMSNYAFEGTLDKACDDAPVAVFTAPKQMTVGINSPFVTPRYTDVADVKSDNLIHAMVRIGRSDYVNGTLVTGNNSIKVVDKFQKGIDIPDALAYIVGIIGKNGTNYEFYPVHEDSLRQYAPANYEYKVGDVQDSIMGEYGKKVVTETIAADEMRIVMGAVMTAAEDMPVSKEAATVSAGTNKEKEFTHKAEASSLAFDATRTGTLTLYIKKQAKQKLTVSEDGKALQGMTDFEQAVDSIEIAVEAGKQYAVETQQQPIVLRGFTFRDADPDAMCIARNIALFKSLYKAYLNVPVLAQLNLTDAIVTYIKSDHVFVEDASGAIAFYQTGIQFYKNQRLNGYIIGKSAEDKLLPLLKRTSKTGYGNFKVAKDSAASTVVTVADMQKQKNLERFVKLENVMLQKDQRGFKILVDTLSGESVLVRDNFGVFYELNDTVQSIEGIVGIDFDGSHYMWPTSKDGVVSTKTIVPEPEPEPEGVETVTATLSLNGAALADPENFFVVAGTYNAKFKDASYGGVDYVSGLKLDSQGKVSFTTPEGVTATVTIVQSTWSDKAIKFDGNNLAVADATAGTGYRVYTFTVEGGEHSIGKGSGESGIFFVKVEYQQEIVEQREPETWDFQELCMKLGKGGPWAVNDGGDAGFTVGDATMHFLGDYTDQGFEWNKHIAYEYVADRGKFTMRNRNNKKDKNCGMFSWDFAHYVSLPDLKKGDQVTITVLAGDVKFVSDNVEGAAAGDKVVSDNAYTIKGDGAQRLDIQMAAASLIAKIVIEPAGVEVIPTVAIDKQTLALIPQATMKLTATSTPAAAKKQWKSDNEAVATIAEDGTVTAVSAGTAKIICYWQSEQSSKTSGDTCVVTVADVDLSEYVAVKTYDFKAMEATTLEIGTEAAGKIWNAANNVNNSVFFCTNAGLEDIAIQAVMGSDNKGWTINENGFFLGTGAGRCAAIGNVKTGQIVEIIYTGDAFYTTSADDGIEKTALNEGVGRAIYKADADGMLGFELIKGNAVEKIVVYDLAGVTAIGTAKAAALQGIVYSLSGQKIADSAKGLKPGFYIIGGRKVVVK